MIKYTHTELLHNTRAAKQILPYIFNLVKPNTVIDIGCGTGSWLSVAKELGSSQVLGLDGIRVGDDIMCVAKEEFREHDLTVPIDLDMQYDLVICLEVAEHLPEEAADNIVDIMTLHGDIILFSAAIPGQGGQFHINEQWPQYWQDKFEKKGYYAFDILKDKFWDNPDIEWWYKQNMIIYAKPEKEIYLKAKPLKTVAIARIHPELYQSLIKNQSEERQYLQDVAEERLNVIRERLWYPKFLPTLKLLLKAISINARH